MTLKRIDSFHGEYRFLSNFYPALTMFDGVLYPTSEHAYQAAKTNNKEARELIRECRTPGDAKRMGKTVKLRDGWTEDSRIAAMGLILGSKFDRNPDLRQKLMDTHPAELIEGNTWGDVFWGVCRGRGENNLGRLLMAIREWYIEEEAIERGG